MEEHGYLDLTKSNKELLEQLKEFDPSIGEEGLKKIRQTVLDVSEGIPNINCDISLVDEMEKNIYDVNPAKLLDLFVTAKIGKGKNKSLINLGPQNEKLNQIKNDLEQNSTDILGNKATYILKNAINKPKVIYIETIEVDNVLYYFISSIDDELIETYAVNGEEFKDGINNEKISLYRIQGYDNSLLMSQLDIKENRYLINHGDIKNHYGLDIYEGKRDTKTLK